jgi:hypothetical protein
MQGAGVLTLFIVLLLIPLELWQASAQKRRLLSPHELNLRRATQPLGVIAVLAWCVWFFGERGIALTPLVLDSVANLLPVTAVGAALLYGTASFISGASRCWGVRSDGMLPTRAFFKLAIGAAGVALLHRNQVTAALGNELWPALLWLALNIAAVWCIAVGAGRLILLTTGGGNALRTMVRAANKRNAPLRPARRRWWQWW